MNKHEADKLIETIRSLIGPTPADALSTSGKLPSEKALRDEIQKPNGRALTMDRATVEGTDNAGGVLKPFADKDLERQFQAFKNRLIEECAIDPTLLHLLTTRPEIVVDVERRVVELDGSNDLKGRIARLIADGFLAQPRKAGHINNELERTGTKAAGNRLSEALAFLKKAGFLIEEDTGWRAAPGVKVTERTIEK